MRFTLRRFDGHIEMAAVGAPAEFPSVELGKYRSVRLHPRLENELRRIGKDESAVTDFHKAVTRFGAGARLSENELGLPLIASIHQPMRHYSQSLLGFRTMQSRRRKPSQQRDQSDRAQAEEITG